MTIRKIQRKCSCSWRSGMAVANGAQSQCVRRCVLDVVFVCKAHVANRNAESESTAFEGYTRDQQCHRTEHEKRQTSAINQAASRTSNNVASTINESAENRLQNRTNARWQQQQQQQPQKWRRKSNKCWARNENESKSSQAKSSHTRKDAGRRRRDGAGGR